MNKTHEVNLWRIPLILTASVAGLFALTCGIDALDSYGVIHLPTWFTMGGIDDARAILSALLGSVSTVLALIFSVALLVLSMVATLFGPRLLYRFLQDWVTQWTIGLFLATFVYLCLVFLVTHQDAHSSFIPQLSLITSWVLVVISFGFLVYYSHRIAVSIQNPDLIARIVDDLRRTEPKSAAAPAPAPAVVGGVASDKSGFVQQADLERLTAAAVAADAVVRLAFRPGQFIFQGETLAMVEPADRAAGLESSVRRHVHVGRHRVIGQDREFAVAQVVEIGIRALSPAVNDTFTGMSCVDWVTDALLVLVAEPADDGVRRDADGTTRVTVPPLRLERVLKLAYDQLRQAAIDTPAVLIRILDTINRIAPRLPEAVRAAALAQADAVRETAALGRLAASDKEQVEMSWRRIREPA
jgi:uncharacterized membrane protein